MSKAAKTARRAGRRHLAERAARFPAPQKRVPENRFDKMAQWLFPDRLSPQLAQLFPERAPGTIRDWRMGRHNTPAWAIERLRIKVAERTNHLLVDIAQIKKEAAEAAS